MCVCVPMILCVLATKEEDYQNSYYLWLVYRKLYHTSCQHIWMIVWFQPLISSALVLSSSLPARYKTLLDQWRMAGKTYHCRPQFSAQSAIFTFIIPRTLSNCPLNPINMKHLSIEFALHSTFFLLNKKKITFQKTYFSWRKINSSSSKIGK